MNSFYDDTDSLVALVRIRDVSCYPKENMVSFTLVIPTMGFFELLRERLIVKRNRPTKAELKTKSDGDESSRAVNFPSQNAKKWRSFTILGFDLINIFAV